MSKSHQRWLPVVELALPEDKGDMLYVVAWAPNIGSDLSYNNLSDPVPRILAKSFRFVMSVTLDGEGKCSKLEGEVRMQHVTYTEDVTAFVILAVTLDLSIDACKLFSQKLQKDLRQ
ncbi:hypothetical protein JHK87_045239 [Glycine soja]|nr:hypothetical protein JHK87_045239 [Glycine soja]